MILCCIAIEVIVSKTGKCYDRLSMLEKGDKILCGNKVTIKTTIQYVAGAGAKE